MKATLEFNLPEDNISFNNAVKANDMHNVLVFMDDFIRQKIKHGHNYDSVNDALVDIRKNLNDDISTRGICLYE